MLEQFVAASIISFVPTVLFINRDKVQRSLADLKIWNVSGETVFLKHKITLIWIFSILVVYIILNNRTFNSDSIDQNLCDDYAMLKLLKHQACKLNPLFLKIGFEISSSSFTQDKTTVFICVRDQKNQLYNYDTLMNVVIHELAHVISQQVDPNHETQEFHSNHSALMAKARSHDLIDLSKIQFYHAFNEN